jgi:hypothetical protein
MDYVTFMSVRHKSKSLYCDKSPKVLGAKLLAKRRADVSAGEPTLNTLFFPLRPHRARVISRTQREIFRSSSACYFAL